MITPQFAKETLSKMVYEYDRNERIMSIFITQQEKVLKLLEYHKRLSYYAKYDGHDPETKERVMELKDQIKALDEELA